MARKGRITREDPTAMTTPPTTPPNASQALRHQRRIVKGVGLRYVADQSRALAEQDPTRYSYVSHGTLSRIERSQGAWFRTNVDMGMLEALVQILWNGNHHAFANDTGLQLVFPHNTQLAADRPTPTVELPYYLEGEHPSLHQRRRRLHEAPDQHADFLYQHHSHDMEPAVSTHHLLTCQHATHAPAGQLAVLQRTTGLTLAWSAGNDTYLTEQNSDPLPLTRNESVYGIVVALRPHRPDLDRSRSRGTEADDEARQELTDLLAQNAPRQREPMKPLTISCPAQLQEALRDEARRLRIPLQVYQETAIEGLLNRYRADASQLPDPLVRPNSDDPNFTARMPTNLLARLDAFVTNVRQITTRTDRPTKAAVVLLAYRQLLTATRETEAEQTPAG